MIEHVKLLGLVLMLFVGTWVTLYIHQLYRRYSQSYLKYLTLYSLIFNLVYFYIVVISYFKLNLQDIPLPFQTPPTSYIVQLIVTLMEIWLLTSLVKITVSLRGKSHTPAFDRVVYGVTIFTLIVFAARIVLSLLGTYYRPITFISSFLFNNLIALELPLLGYAYYAQKRVSDPALRRIGIGFILFFAARYVAGAFFYVLIMLLKVDDTSGLVLRLPFHLLFNLTPYLWCQIYLVGYMKRRDFRDNSQNQIDKFCKAHNITKREQEIVELLFDGLNNREIQEYLSISYHTVKNHLYNIYQKLGIQSRHELVTYILSDQSWK